MQQKTALITGVTGQDGAYLIMRFQMQFRFASGDRTDGTLFQILI